MIAKIPATLRPAMVNRQTFQAFGVFSSDNEEVALLSSLICRTRSSKDPDTRAGSARAVWHGPHLSCGADWHGLMGAIASRRCSV
jgi:hypothetical protein